MKLQCKAPPLLPSIICQMDANAASSLAYMVMNGEALSITALNVFVLSKGMPFTLTSMSNTQSSMRYSFVVCAHAVALDAFASDDGV